MPNQLAQFKKGTSLAEHEAVLALLSELAREDGMEEIKDIHENPGRWSR